MTRTYLTLCLTAVSLLWAGPAHAHKMKIFATTDGQTISGYAYLSGGGRIQATTVNVFDPSNQSEPVTNVVTDAEGRFSFRASPARDHLLRIDLGDGHMAEWLVKGEGAPAEPADLTAANPMQDDTGQAGMHSLQQQVTQLQEQLESYEERVRLHDVLGGIGYILGMAGLTFYFMAKRNRP